LGFAEANRRPKANMNGNTPRRHPLDTWHAVTRESETWPAYRLIGVREFFQALPMRSRGWQFAPAFAHCSARWRELTFDFGHFEYKFVIVPGQ